MLTMLILINGLKLNFWRATADLLKLLVVLKTLISWIRCVGLRSEQNCAKCGFPGIVFETTALDSRFADNCGYFVKYRLFSLYKMLQNLKRKIDCI